MNKTQAGRLLTLAHFLRTQVMPRNFDMRNWFRGYNPDDLHDPPCGTAACVAGWCAVVFPNDFSIHRSAARFRGGLIYESHTFFGLDLFEIEILYHGPHKTPKHAAAFIERLAGEHGWKYA